MDKRPHAWGSAKATLVSALLLLGVACAPPASRQPGAQGSSRGEKTTVYFVTLSDGNRFWALVERGAKDAARLVGAEVIWTQGQELSIEQTIDRMNTAIAARPDYMVVTDINPAAMNPVIEKAKQAGIHVININAEDPSGKPPYRFYVGASEYESGRAAAQATLDDPRPAPKRAACVIHVQGHAGLEARCKGYTDVLKAAGVTVDKIDISGGPEEAEEKTRAYFKANPDAEAIYTLSAGSEAFDPVLKVLRTGHLTRKVTFVTNDTSDAAFQAIREGDLVAAIDQQPYLQGYLPVIWADLHSKYEFLPVNDMYTGPLLVTKDNVSGIEQLVKANYR